MASEISREVLHVDLVVQLKYHEVPKIAIEKLVNYACSSSWSIDHTLDNLSPSSLLWAGLTLTQVLLYHWNQVSVAKSF